MFIGVYLNPAWVGNKRFLGKSGVNRGACGGCYALDHVTAKVTEHGLGPEIHLFLHLALLCPVWHLLSGRSNHALA